MSMSMQSSFIVVVVVDVDWCCVRTTFLFLLSLFAFHHFS